VRADPDKRMSFADLAYVAYLQSPLLPKDVGPGLRASASFDLAADGVFSNATHGVVVELDPAGAPDTKQSSTLSRIAPHAVVPRYSLPLMRTGRPRMRRTEGRPASAARTSTQR
jgi:hypothetical protein